MQNTKKVYLRLALFLGGTPQSGIPNGFDEDGLTQQCSMKCLLALMAGVGWFLQLRHTNIYTKNIGWGRDGISPVSNRAHAYYLECLCNDFQKIIINQFNRSATLIVL